MKCNVFAVCCSLSVLVGCANIDPVPRPDIDAGLTWNSALAASGASEDGSPSANWWQTFSAEPLDTLMRQALQNSPDLMAAEQRLRQADWQMRATGASVYPSVNVGAATSRRSNQDIEGDSRSSESTSTNLGLSYELDLWGRVAAERASARAGFRASEQDYRAAYLSLTGAIANTWFEYQALQARIQIALDNIALSEQVMNVVQVRYRNGVASAADVARQRTNLLSQKAQLPPLEYQMEQTRRALAVLVGEVPQTLSVEPQALSDIRLPELKAQPPVEAIFARPDVARAEAQLQAADADVAVARRAFLPSLSLSAGFSLSTAELFSLSDARESDNTGLSLSQLIFDGGRTRARSRQAEARRQELLAQYRQTLLVALQETDDALGRVTLEAGQEISDQAILAEAERALRLTEVRYREGSDDLLTLIDAQRSLFQARERLVERRLDRLSAAVTLYQSLGGSGQQ
ncbi:efflux transporter outer membrane subunit [Marinimicrobium sp. C6131]|uniref:efflux transporter outer membrane subunit n=1 Tax=Marinimicrobium sp. C6131 TaxID=3022676 RepID=UPI00223DD26D|nr:efflux transporter outer membrane subunit [Marinimicrobium sp. C6131]UZJ45282.1 efflux transporter outer membrane subunit [Marinimicrobium sp. C6131]